MNNLRNILFTTIIGLLMISCNDIGLSKTDKYYSYTAYPFRSSDDANWGMISSDGEIIFRDEFQHLPTRVSNERFLIKNKDSLFTFYRAEAKPKKIGKQYVYATDFNNDGFAVVSQIKKGIQVINKKGETIYSVDKAVGQQVDMMTPFNQEGLAIFTIGHHCGVINTEGKVILKARYHIAIIGTGKEFLAIDKKYQDAYEKGEYKDVEVNTFKNDGTPINKFNLGKFIWIPTCIDGNYIAYQKTGEGSICGLIDNSGNWIVKPTRNIQEITDCKYGVFVYYDGDQYGLCSVKGKDLIRAKYDNLHIVSKNRLWAYEKNKNVTRCKLIDFNDNQIGNNFYKFGSYFNDGWALAQVNDNDWIFVNDKGEENQDITNISQIDYNVASNLVFSNYLNISTLLNAIALKDSSLNGFTFNMKVKDVLNKAYILNDSVYTGTFLTKNPQDFIYTNSISFAQDFHNTILEYKIIFDKDLVVENKFTDATPTVLVCEIPYIYNANGRLTDIYIHLASLLKKMGKLVKSNKNAIVVEGKSCYFFAAMVGKQVLLKVYKNGSINPQYIDITKYKKMTEKNWLRSYPNTDDYTDYNDFTDEDNAEVDTVVADTTLSDYEY